MQNKRFSCPNGCKLPPRRRVLLEKEDHTYGYGYKDYLYCPVCGSLMPDTRKRIESFFNVYHIHHKLETAERLVYKSEYNSAVLASG